MVILFINQNCYALEEREFEEEGPCNILISLKKCLNYIICNSSIQEEENEFLSYSSDFFSQSGITALPTEVLHKICYELSPLNILYLSMASKNIEGKIDDRFWKTYLKIHKWDIWSDSVSFKKVAFAHYWFKEGNLGKAAHLNHPRAIKILENRKKIKEEKYEQYKMISPYGMRESHFYIWPQIRVRMMRNHLIWEREFY